MNTETDKPKRGRGRPRKAANIAYANIREAFKQAFDKIGGAEALAKWGKEDKNRKDFYYLAARLIPIVNEGPNADGSSTLKVEIVKFTEAAKETPAEEAKP